MKTENAATADQERACKITSEGARESLLPELFL